MATVSLFTPPTWLPWRHMNTLYLWCWYMEVFIWTVDWNEVWSLCSSQCFDATYVKRPERYSLPYPLQCRCAALPIELSDQLGACCYLNFSGLPHYNQSSVKKNCKDHTLHVFVFTSWPRESFDVTVKRKASHLQVTKQKLMTSQGYFFLNIFII